VWADNPVGYAHEVLGLEWWEKQCEIAESVKNNANTLVVASHGVGKTFVCAGLVNWFYDAFKSSTVVTTAPTWPQVEKILWPLIRGQRRTLPEPGITEIKDPEDPLHMAYGRSPGRRIQWDEFGSQAFQGIHGDNLLLVFDEAAGIEADTDYGVFDLMIFRRRLSLTF